MKKVIFLLAAVLLCGCSCLLSQVPPQTIYVDSNCQGRLPDYTKIVQAADNCGDVTLTQLPAANTLLDVNTPAVTVIVTGVDRFGNRSQLQISVLLIDTVPPILSWPVGQSNLGAAATIDLYRNWEAAVKVEGIAKWVHDMRWTQGLPLADTARIMESLKTFNHAITLSDAEYAQYLNYVNSK